MLDRHAVGVDGQRGEEEGRAARGRLGHSDATQEGEHPPTPNIGWRRAGRKALFILNAGHVESFCRTCSLYCPTCTTATCRKADKPLGIPTTTDTGGYG